MFFKEYQTVFFRDNETLDFIESNLPKRVSKKYRLDDTLRVITRRPIESSLVDFLRESHNFRMYVTYDKRDSLLWIFRNGEEFSFNLGLMDRPMDYKEFVDNENLLIDVIYKLLHGMAYNGLIDIDKLADVEENLLIQKCYWVDPAREYNKLFFCKKYSKEDYKIYLDFCKVNKNIVENVDPEVPYTLLAWDERRFFNADKEHLINLISNGDLDVCWYWHLTVLEYAALALPGIQCRLKAGDEGVLCKLEEMFEFLGLGDVIRYKQWLIKSRNFGE